MRRLFPFIACIALIVAFGPEAFALDPQRDIVERAREYVGCAYSRGGTRPPEFDCSGFVGFIMRPFAPKLPRLSHDMAGFGAKVEKSSLRPGDLVFFATSDVPGAVSHVAIYVGDGSIIHAISDGPERGVRVTPLDARYWKKHYHSATRVLSGGEPAKADAVTATKSDTMATAKPDATAKAKPDATAKAIASPAKADAKVSDAKAASAKASAANNATNASSPWDTWDGYVMGDYAQWKEAERAKLAAQENAYDKDKERNDFEAWKKANGE